MDNNETQSVEMVQISSDNLPMSIDYSGRYISKIDLMIYLNNLIRMRTQINKMMQDTDERSSRVNGLIAAKNRRQFSIPIMEKPTGFAALSRKRQQEYQDWLDKADERAAELAAMEKAEDERIASIDQEIEKLQKENFATLKASRHLADLYAEECKKQIISPDYRELEILTKILGYLFNGRANTLAEAINLYHEEQYRDEIKAKVDQQSIIAQVQFDQHMRAQLMLLEEQRAMREEQAEQAAEQQRALNRAADSLDDIRFYEQMRYLQGL